MKRKFPRILFFINGPVPTEADEAEAMELGLNVAFRNAAMVTDEGCLEECDGVAGEVPERYKVIPTAAEALTAFAQDMRRKADAPEEGEEEKPKGKGKAASEKPAAGEISQPEIAPVAPANPPAWKPNA